LQINSTSSQYWRGDVGIIRVMFPKAPNSAHAHLTEISWHEFCHEFEERQLALLCDPDGMFSRIVGHATTERRGHGEHKAAR
jgi:hypothetical protein